MLVNSKEVLLKRHKHKSRLILISLFLFSNSLFSESFRVVYSSSLVGNLYSCVCGLKLSVGIAKRATFLKQKNIDPAKDILVDTGNSLDVGCSFAKTKAIFSSFKKIGYRLVGIGGNDLQKDTISILEANSDLVQSANVFTKGFLSSNLHFTSPIILSHSNHTKLKA